MSAEPEIRHESDRHRFVVEVDGQVAVLDYRREDGRVVFTHTGVPPALEGRGIGSRLVRAGLGWARDTGLEVVPACAFVRAWVERHPEFGVPVRDR